VAKSPFSNDLPINCPADDRFGLDDFAKTLASGIHKMNVPNGYVIALNGVWGSGKSSTINLIRHHLKVQPDTENVVVIDFACWWFRGEEALALAFFRALYAGIGESLGEKFQNSLKKIASLLGDAGHLVGAAIDLHGGNGIGKIVSAGLGRLGKRFHTAETLEALNVKLMQTLQLQSKRFVITIDDIDRLSPEEALLVFRLIKSVGRLPNVIYLLAFDRALAEKIVADKFPSEGPHYLEKIIQANFYIPPPIESTIRDHLIEQIWAICGEEGQTPPIHVMNVFYDVILPKIRTPRDIIRFVNALAVTWPAVKGDVEMGDFVGLESLRIFCPKFYEVIRDRKDVLCETRTGAMESFSKQQIERIDNSLFSDMAASKKDHLKGVLMRLFPSTKTIFGNHSVSIDTIIEWERTRRACSKDHFDTYFRLAPSDDVLRHAELDELIKRADDRNFIVAAMEKALLIRRSNRKTKASLILDELVLHARRVADIQIGPLLSTIFSLGDELDVDADGFQGGYDYRNNFNRIHLLVDRLLLERSDLQGRSRILSQASADAALGWLAYFALNAHFQHNPPQGKEPVPESGLLLTQADAEALRQSALERIRANTQLEAHLKLGDLLFRWRELSGDDGQEVRQWTGARLERDNMVKKLAQALTSYGWTQNIGSDGLGDRVFVRRPEIHLDEIPKIVDANRFRQRVAEVAQRDVDVRKFFHLWQQQERPGG